ncbi:MAG: hypothetical protein V4492_04680, partial [Chlamydiota bacterium]
MFDVSFPLSSSSFDYGTVESVSFFFSGLGDVAVDPMIESLAKGKAEVIVTGKESLEGPAMSPGLSVRVTGIRNADGKSLLVKIESRVSG